MRGELQHMWLSQHEIWISWGYIWAQKTPKNLKLLWFQGNFLDFTGTSCNLRNKEREKETKKVPKIEHNASQAKSQPPHKNFSVNTNRMKIFFFLKIRKFMIGHVKTIIAPKRTDDAILNSFITKPLTWNSSIRPIHWKEREKPLLTLELKVVTFMSNQH